MPCSHGGGSRRECTLLAPTWLLSRRLFDTVGGFLDPPPGSKYHIRDGEPPAVPEDLIFFNQVWHARG